jgi:hypothetical protein
MQPPIFACIMLRLFGPILLLVVMLTQTLTRGLWVLQYYLDPTDYLEQCENKNNPALGCAGQCVLKKELQRMDCCNTGVPGDNHGKTPVPSKFSEKNTLSPFVLQDKSLSLSNGKWAVIGRIPLPGCLIPAGVLESDDIFHPPA